MSSVEAVRDIVNYLNQGTFPTASSPHGPDMADDSLHGPLFIKDDAIHATYAGLRLGTLFQPIIPLTSPLSTRHEAFLTIENPIDGTIRLHSEQHLPAQIRLADADVIYFDRLARTLHTLNFLAQGGPGDLYLNVHPNHLLAVCSNHGHVFERILQQCGLSPEQIVLEISEHTLRDKQRLKAAITAWQSRGYRIAVDHFSGQQAKVQGVLALNPQLIKIAGTELRENIPVDRIAAQLQATVRRIRAAEVEVIFIAADSELCRQVAHYVDFDAIQGPAEVQARDPDWHVHQPHIFETT